MTEQTLQPGQIFAERYRIERLLARGGFGAVYVAEQLATEAYVAVKILWPHILSSEAAVVSFQQEARIAGRVGSEYIVRVLDAGFDASSAMPYLVMELLQGQDLQRVVEESGALSPDLTISLMRQVASALDRAHGYLDKDGSPRPIVHRDLKPENLFLTQRENGEPMVKVLDFGIAKVMSATAKVSHEVKGTPLYMAYEQASGGLITAQTDVWALGLIVYFLLTGKSYWKAAQSEESSLTHLFGEVLSLPITSPSARLAELGDSRTLPLAFDEWFSHCVNRDQSLRFPTAGAAIVALHEAFGVSAPVSIAHRPASASAVTVAFGVTPATGATAHSLALSGIEQRPSRGPKIALFALLSTLITGAAVAAIVLGMRSSHAPAPPSSEPASAPPSSPATPPAEPTLTPSVTPMTSKETTPTDAGAPRAVVQRPRPKRNVKDKAVYGER